MIEKLKHWYWMHRGCRHEWHNTGASYTDKQRGFTVVLRQCDLCQATLIIEVKEADPSEDPVNHRTDA